MCEISGAPAISSSGFGISAVNAPSRFPRPAANSTAVVISVLTALKNSIARAFKGAWLAVYS